MKTTKIPSVPPLDSSLDLCVDVSKSTLHIYCEIGNQAVDDAWPHTPRPIERKLGPYQTLARPQGFKSLRVLCEPFDGYQNKLLRTARRLGHRTAYVHGEAVAPFRLVERNDPGQTDLKEPLIIHPLGRLHKMLTHRILPEGYPLLRTGGPLYGPALGRNWTAE